MALLLLLLLSQDLSDLLNRAADPDPLVRAAAAEALAAHVRATEIPRDDESPHAVLGRAMAGDRRARRGVDDLLESADPVVLAHVLSLIGEPSRSAVRRIAELAAHEHPVVAVRAARLVGRAEDPILSRIVEAPDIIPVALALLADPATRTRAAALLAADDASLPALRLTQNRTEWTAMRSVMTTAETAEADRALLGSLMRGAAILPYGEIVEWAAGTSAAAAWAQTRLGDPDARDIAWLASFVPAAGTRTDGDWLRTRVADRLGGAPDQWAAIWAAEKVRLAYTESERAIADGVRWLRALQQPDGRWLFCRCAVGAEGAYEYPAYFHTGTTAYAVYTMLWCDVDPADDAIRRGLESVLAAEGGDWETTYVASCTAQAISEYLHRADPRTLDREWARRLHDRLEAAATYIANAQNLYESQGGTGVQPGAWSYGREYGGWDNSNTQFAILGLAAAHRAGIEVPRAVLERALEHWERQFEPTEGESRWPPGETGQTSEGNGAPVGGWRYVPPPPPDQGGAWPMSMSMTGAGICCVDILRAILDGRGTEEIARTEPRVRGAITHLMDHHELPTTLYTGSPNHGPGIYYSLYSLERAMVLSGVRHLGERDWYADGAAHIMASQRPDGGWFDPIDTCFALLFLKRATPFVSTGR